MGRKILPTSGACAVFTIDPVASLNAETREDSEAVAACRTLTSKKYAVVVDRQDLYEHWEPHNECVVHFILRGVPPAIPDKCIEPSMSLPILPVTNEAHPSSRDPLKPSTPLPWSDCYITGFSFARVRSPTLFTEEPIEYVFDADEVSRAHRFLRADVQTKRWALAEKAYEDAQRAQSAMPPVSGDEHDLNQAPRVESSRPVPQSASIPPPDPDHTPGHQGEDEANDDDRSSSSSEVSAAISVKRPPQGLVMVNFTHDLSMMEELSDPQDFFKEVEAIGRIEEEAWPRVAKAKAQAMKDVMDAAASKDAAAYDDLTVDLLIERETFKSRIYRFASKVKNKSRKIAQRIIRLARPRPEKWC
ncbi:hypothetical protein DFH06DRAFT_579235 [Mycena polygramma]|nr:hypothetical protein DFH06DRAFT_579235 [Mycena polygramma]